MEAVLVRPQIRRPMRPLDGQVAIVTGGARGIGEAICRELAQHGAAVVVNYMHSAEKAKGLVAELAEYDARAIAVQADVSQYAEAQRLVDVTLKAFGQVDILVNNAGITADKTLKNMSEEAWHSVITVNLDSVFNCTKAVIPHMIARKYGRIVNISSVIGQMGNLGQANYAAAKAGIIGFTKSTAQELARSGITVNVICPGFIETDMFSDVPDQAKETIVSRIPMRRLGQPEEVAQAVLYLVAHGNYVTGEQLNINGGLYM